MVFSGRPRYRAQDIKRILAVKVDHIGDFVTAFPAFRKLKKRFPKATLHVLAAPSAKHLLELEPSIDEMIPFEFFHARSSLGQNEAKSRKNSKHFVVSCQHTTSTSQSIFASIPKPECCCATPARN